VNQINMNTYISLLRGINVGGRKKLPMESLRRMYQDLGFTNIKTYLQSGNVVFASSIAFPTMLTQLIEAGIAQACGYAVQVFIRRVEEIQRIVSNNPYLENKNIDATRLHVLFLYQQPVESAWNKVTASANIPDQFARGETVLYLHYPNGYAKAKLPASFFEKLLGVPLTDRNWNTVTALKKIAVEMDAALREGNLDAS
jgi:uncharacterized protein (DUF1697 family)